MTKTSPKTGELAVEDHLFPSGALRPGTLMHYSIDGTWLPDNQRCRFCGDWLSEQRFCGAACREGMSRWLLAREAVLLATEPGARDG